tara:strand:- start:1027 stop:1746 length:720 start_codon:yes stop_codon:yes gene_type:complete
MKFLCIVPIYNEESKLKELLEKINVVNKQFTNLDFLLINNGSTDQTNKIVSNSNLNLVTFEKNFGVGYALIYGMKYAIKNNYQYIIHLAGNGKMLPEEINKFMRKILDEKFNFVSGSRFLPNGNFQSNPKTRVFMIRILSFVISLIYFKKITDATCGFRAFDVDLLKNKIYLFDNKKFYTYKYEYYSIGKILLNKKIKFTEIPITMNYTKKDYTKIRPIIDWYPIIAGWLQARFDGTKL